MPQGAVVKVVVDRGGGGGGGAAPAATDLFLRASRQSWFALFNIILGVLFASCIGVAWGLFSAMWRCRQDLAAVAWEPMVPIVKTILNDNGGLLESIQDGLPDKLPPYPPPRPARPRSPPPSPGPPPAPLFPAAPPLTAAAAALVDPQFPAGFLSSRYQLVAYFPFDWQGPAVGADQLSGSTTGLRVDRDDDVYILAVK